MKPTGVAFLALLISSAPAYAFDMSGFSAAGGAMPQSQAQWQEVERQRLCNAYLANGQTPPAMCAGPSAAMVAPVPQQQYVPPPVTRCMWIGSIWTCR